MGEYHGPIYCDECYDSPTAVQGTSPSADVHCKVVGTWSKYDAYDCAMAWIADNRRTENSCPLESVTLKPIEGCNAWDVNIHYSLKKRDAGESFNYQFSTTGETSHTTYSRQTKVARSCIPGMPVIDFHGGIGWNDNKYDGVDINTPAFSWSQSTCWPLAFVTDNYKKLLARYTCCINSKPFAGFAAGEVRFNGITDGSIVEENDNEDPRAPVYYYYKLTYSFSAMPNANDLRVGNSGLISKGGWDYMWVHRMKVTNPDTGATVNIPRQVNVEQVYPYVDLNALCLNMSLISGGVVRPVRG